MLVEWKGGRGDNATTEVLQEALAELGMDHLLTSAGRVECPVTSGSFNRLEPHCAFKPRSGIKELQQCLFIHDIGIPKPRQLEEVSIPKPTPGKKYTAFPLTYQEIPLKVT